MRCTFKIYYDDSKYTYHVGMYGIMKFCKHLTDNPVEELEDVELPEALENGITLFWQLQVCAKEGCIKANQCANFRPVL